MPATSQASRGLARLGSAGYEAPVDPRITGEDPRIVALLRSYDHYLGQSLCAAGELFDAPFVVLAHGTETPPGLFYGNRAALALWEVDFPTFTAMPSFRTAEPDVREGRARLLADVERQGVSEDYTGVLVSSSGRRFEIQRATIWNILDAAGMRIGQAATFRDYRRLAGVE